MKRFRILAAGIVLGLAAVGCDGGIEEGPPKEGSQDPQPADFKEFMKKNGEKMSPKGKMAKPKGAAPDAPATTPTPAPAPEAEKKTP